MSRRWLFVCAAWVLLSCTTENPFFNRFDGPPTEDGTVADWGTKDNKSPQSDAGADAAATDAAAADAAAADTGLDDAAPDVAVDGAADGSPSDAPQDTGSDGIGDTSVDAPGDAGPPDFWPFDFDLPNFDFNLDFNFDLQLPDLGDLSIPDLPDLNLPDGSYCGDLNCDVGESCDGRDGTISCPLDCPGRSIGPPKKIYCWVDGVCVGPGC